MAAPHRPEAPAALQNAGHRHLWLRWSPREGWLRLEGPTPVRSDRSAKPAAARRAWRRFESLKQLGWPRSFPIVQFPNVPLIVAFLAGAAAARTHGSDHAYLLATAYLAMGIWAYEELLHGVNWFRHLLGLAYAISTLVHLALAIGR